MSRSRKKNDGDRFPARRARKGSKKCDVCGSDAVRNDTYDSYYCPRCEEWLENGCGHPACDFCSGRPEHPPLGSPKVAS